MQESIASTNRPYFCYMHSSLFHVISFLEQEVAAFSERCKNECIFRCNRFLHQYNGQWWIVVDSSGQWWTGWCAAGAAACPTQIRFRSDSDPTQIRLRFDSESIDIRLRSDSDSIQNRLRFDSDPIEIRFRSDSDSIEIRFRSDSDPIQIRLRFDSDSIQNPPDSMEN